jgi:hypothetical protein
MQGYYWYLALVVLSIMIIAITYWKSRNKLISILLFGVAGLSYLIENIILIWLKAYVYYPGFIQDKLADSILGAIVSDLFSLPSTAVLIAVFQLNWVWIILISGMFAGVEMLFLKLGIYKHYWWKTYYTFISLIFFYTLIKKWFHWLNNPHGRILSIVTLILSLHFIKTQFSIIIYELLKTGQYSVRWIEALGRPSYAISTPINLYVAISLTSLIIFRARLIWKAAAIVGLFVVDIALFKLHIIQIHTYWHFVYLILSNVFVLLIGQVFGNLLRQNEVPE